jgi:hypothetical protein
MNISQDVSYQRTHLQNFRNYCNPIIIVACIPGSMALMLGVSRLLAMVKDIGGLHPIARCFSTY